MAEMVTLYFSFRKEFRHVAVDSDKDELSMRACRRVDGACRQPMRWRCVRVRELIGPESECFAVEHRDWQQSASREMRATNGQTKPDMYASHHDKISQRSR